jgi:zinc transport system ATP-binding protein
MNKLIELENVWAGYNGKMILEDINLSVVEKDFIGIIGPNGGGKSTLLKVILNLLNISKGTIKYFENAKEITEMRFGYLPQIISFDYKFPINVLDVALSGLMNKQKIIKRFTSDEKERAKTLLDKFGVYKFKNRPIGELSGGQIQRVLLSRALISSPSVLLLDEPNTFVDSNFEQELYDQLVELNNDIAIIIVSHDLGMISAYVKTIACVNQTLHYHPSNEINNEVLKSYDCPIDLITHGKVPHRVLKNH